MKKEIIKSLTNEFKSYVKFTNQGVEFWFARDLQHLLGYTEWRNFKKVINKAKTACETVGYLIIDRYVDTSKTIFDSRTRDSFRFKSDIFRDG
ncbi:MAG: BRO family protein [Fidelibacterota bacterium]